MLESHLFRVHFLTNTVTGREPALKYLENESPTLSTERGCSFLIGYTKYAYAKTPTDATAFIFC
jgi:hypothetical protein